LLPWRFLLLKIGQVAPFAFAAVLCAIGLAAHGQSNLDAGKSPAQIFADTCNACHRSPREIKKTTPAFLREHYTTGLREATTMAAYLANVGSDPRAVQQRRPPTMGAGQTPGPEAHPPAAPTTPEQTKPETQAALPAAAPPTSSASTGEQPGSTTRETRPRRPSESMESALPAPEPAVTQPAMPAQKRHLGQEIEE
jgi:hypothetical protein